MSFRLFSTVPNTLALAAVQPAIVAMLRNDSTLGHIVKQQVYDGIASSGAMVPYVVIGEITENPADTLTRIGRKVNTTIHVFSNQRSNKEAAQISARVVALLNRVHLPLGEWYSVSARFLSLQAVADDDGVRHHVLRFEHELAPLPNV